MSAETVRPRDVALDIRSGREGEVMAEPHPPGRRNYFLRPVGGGTEWEVPCEYVQIIKRAETAA